MLSLLGWILFGAITGWVANTMTGAKHKNGCLANVVIGLTGAIIGGILGNIAFGHDAMKWNISSFVLSIAGAILLLLLIRKLGGSY